MVFKKYVNLLVDGLSRGIFPSGSFNLDDLVFGFLVSTRGHRGTLLTIGFTIIEAGLSSPVGYSDLEQAG